MQVQQQKQKKIVITIHPQISKWREDTNVADPALQKDLKENKQLNALLVRKISETEDTITVQLLGGYCRYREFLELGVKPEDMLLNIRENVSDKEALLLAYSDNRFRKQFTPIADAHAFRDMENSGMFVDEIAMRTGHPETYVKGMLNLLQLPDYIQDAMIAHKIKLGYAKALLLLTEYPDQQKMLASSIIKNGYDAPKVETAEAAAKELIKGYKHQMELVKLWGPCPKCGSTNIADERDYYSDTEKLKMKCLKQGCGHAWNKKTKEPWDVFSLRINADKLGLELKIEENGKIVAAPKDITTLVKEQQEKLKELEKGNFRTVRNIETLLPPILKTKSGGNNVFRFRLEGDKLEITLVEDTGLHLSAAQHDYQSGEKTQVKAHSVGYNGDSTRDAANVENIKKLIETLTRD